MVIFFFIIVACLFPLSSNIPLPTYLPPFPTRPPPEETMLRIEMEDWSGKRYLATYDHFRVDGARENFTLHISGYSGDAGDSMNSVWENHDGMPFSTKDRDNDGRYVDSGLHGSPHKINARFVPFS